ncbi:MAG: hypothetical protein IRZ16_19590 [Myxococcaceae bacterium]|nr:hypothetical protein [Myxococcaceae bacterium]
MTERDALLAARFRQRRVIGLAMAACALVAAVALEVVHVDRQDAWAFVWVVLAVGLVRAAISTLALRRYRDVPPRKEDDGRVKKP